MSNRRQIPFLYWRPLADGTEVADWKPSPRLRKLGWTNLVLGSSADRKAAINAALDQNEKVAEWEAAPEPSTPGGGPKVWTFSDLVDAYQASNDWKVELKPATKAEYGTRLRQLSAWARDAQGKSIPVGQLDDVMVRDLKEALLPVSRFRCASTLRVLRLLLNWGKNNHRKVIRHNATDGVRIPGTDSRQQKMAWHQAAQLADAADQLGFPVTARAIRVAFWSLQRQGDLVELNRLSWRTLESMDPRDRAALVNHQREVRGFRLRQNKTGAWIDAPIPAFLHAEIEAAFADGAQWLLPDPDKPDQQIPQWKLQRQTRAALRQLEMHDHQFRDLRRSGMAFFKDNGALQSNIFAISGHPVMGKRTIADTYMPPDTLGACAAVAAVLRTMQRIERREQDHG
jgi:hypothetical protein